MGLLLIVLGNVAQLIEGMATRACSKKHGNGGLLFSALISFFSMIFFIITNKEGMFFPNEIWVYGIISGIMYAGGYYYMYLALNLGSFALTRILTTFSLLFPIFYGIFFLQEDVTFFMILGIILMVISMILTNYVKADITEKKNFSGKWLLYTIITLLCNGFISIISRMQQIKFNNECTNRFFIISLATSFVILFGLSLIKDHKNLSKIIKSSVIYSFSAGVLSGFNNLCTVVAYLYIPLSLASPLKTGVSLLLGFLASLFIYKEKFTKNQLFGMVMGFLAVILLRL